MRIIFFILYVIAVVNLLIMVISGLTGVNFYKKYGKAIISGFFKFLLILVVMFIAIAISGLSS